MKHQEVEPDEVKVRLITLGAPDLRRNGRGDPSFAVRRLRAALLVYLAVEGRTSRDQLMGVLWGDRPDDRARHMLNQTLYEIRRELGSDAVESHGNHVQLADHVESDVADLREAARRQEHRRVLELYKGPFLDGFYLPDCPAFSDWVDATRVELAALHGRSFPHVIGEDEDGGNFHSALTLARAWTRWHENDEAARAALVRLLLLVGRRDEARKHYRRWEGYVASELGRPPDATLWAPLLGRLAPSADPGEAESHERDEALSSTLQIFVGERARGPRLVLLRAPGREEVYRLHVGENILGRSEGDVTFPENESLSARHASVVVERRTDGSERCVLRDLDSRNGTYLRIHGSRPVGDGDVFLVGRQAFQVRRRDQR